MKLHEACTTGTSLGLTVASLQRLKMQALISAPADCEVRSVMKFLNAQSIALIEIHRQLCQVYGPNVMSKQMVHRWCRQFTAGQQHEESSGRRSIFTDDLVMLVRERIMENRRFTILRNSAVISRSLLHKIVNEHMLFTELCARWVSKQLPSEHTAKRMESALAFLQRYHDDGDKFVDRIVTGDET